MRFTAALTKETFPAASMSRTVNCPPAAIAACRSAAAAKFKLKFTELSPAAMEVSVAMVVEPSTSSAEPPVAWPATTVALAVMFVLFASNVFATTTPPAGVTTTLVGAAGATVSITIAFAAPSEPVAPGLAKVRTASLPEASLINPLLRARAAFDCASRSLLASPACTTYLNVSTDVPEPLLYVAKRSCVPVSSKSVGEPADVVTTTTLLNVTATSIVAPARYEPFAVGELTLETVGITVSTTAVSTALAVFWFPTASLNTPARTCTDIGVVELLVGVKVNE